MFIKLTNKICKTTKCITGVKLNAQCIHFTQIHARGSGWILNFNFRKVVAQFFTHCIFRRLIQSYQRRLFFFAIHWYLSDKIFLYLYTLYFNKIMILMKTRGGATAPGPAIFGACNLAKLYVLCATITGKICSTNTGTEIITNLVIRSVERISAL